MFHIDMTSIQDIMESIEGEYGRIYITEPDDPVKGKDEELLEYQDMNMEKYLNALRSLILEFRVSSLDRLRLWRWREEVFLGRVGNELPIYPGVPIVYYFETTAELLENGISSYYFRVGEVKRETLMERYEFFDLYHMAGQLAYAHPNDVKFDSRMKFEDLADLILALLEDIAVDPRHIISPLGVHSIFNSEPTEYIFNLSQYKGNIRPVNIHMDHIIATSGSDHDQEKLKLACTDAGITISTVTETEVPLDPSLGNITVIDDDKPLETTFISVTEPKPFYVLLEELTSQYLSPQFYSSIEYHRNYESALKSLKTLSGDRITNANQSEVIFYGVGDGLSPYNVYTPRELANVFESTKHFFDPASIKRNPELPYMWSTFSAQSLQRLLLIVIPRLRAKSHGFTSSGKIQNQGPTLDDVLSRNDQLVAQGELYRKDLDDLERIIESNFEIINYVDPNTIDEIIKPMGRQQNIINHLKAKLDNVLNQTKTGETLAEANVSLPLDVTENLNSYDLNALVSVDNGFNPVNYGIRGDLTLFFAHLFNLGVQFSSWTEMTQISQEAISQAILANNLYKYVNPEWTINLTEKIFNMVTLEMEKYFDVRDVVYDYPDDVEDLTLETVYSDEGDIQDDPISIEIRDPANVEMANRQDKKRQMRRGKQYGQYLRELRLVKFYNGAYRIDWNDELSTINGQLLRVVQANKIGLYEYVQSSGNWFMSTAYYYSMIFNGVAPGDIGLKFVPDT